jgi:hypothetical protein
MTGDPPAGTNCPGCEHPAVFLFGDDQAFCESPDCHVLMWNPRLSAAANMADMQQIQLPGWETPG